MASESKSGAEENSERYASNASHRVVIELVSGDPEGWEKLMNNSENLLKAFDGQTTELKIVCHGEGLKMLMNSSSNKPKPRMQELSKKGVVFAACQNTMARLNLEASDLVSWAVPVDSGVAEIVRKQAEGWAYIYR